MPVVRRYIGLERWLSSSRSIYTKAFPELIDCLGNSRPGGRLPWSRNVTAAVPSHRGAANDAAQSASLFGPPCILAAINGQSCPYLDGGLKGSQSGILRGDDRNKQNVV